MASEYTAIKQLVQLECAHTHEILVFDPPTLSEALKSETGYVCSSTTVPLLHSGSA